MDNLLNQIKADREAGTPGPWRVTTGGCVQSDMHGGRHEVARSDTFWGLNRGLENARRIACVPDMEAALLAAGELADAVAESLSDTRLDNTYTQEEALAAFHKAIKVKNGAIREPKHDEGV